MKADAEPETEPETAAPKRDVYDLIDLNEGGNNVPISLLAEGSSVAARFVVAEGGYVQEMIINCPSWSDDVGNLTFKIFKWDTDYETTVAAAPVAEQVNENYADNAYISFVPGENVVSSGEYLIWVGDGGSGVGIWGFDIFPELTGKVTGFYKNGEEQTENGLSINITVIIPAV